LLLRNRALSNGIDDESFVQAVSQVGGQLCNLFLPMEAFPIPAKAGAMWIEAFKFLLPSEIAAADGVERSAGVLSIPEAISWGEAPPPNSLAAWLGNTMQQNAAAELYQLEAAVKGCKDSRLLEDWRKLTASDHFRYMSTLPIADSPYDSPYDAYINFMNVLDNLRGRL